ncbi:MAG TPA: DnaJ C-terminal domain-containing protein [Acidimicrobiales bacterium]|jgi:curved DNA-binding protein|nr:DnaJ C-terminal domain-containing protein [Acidimicrobiales bacterium]
MAPRRDFYEVLGVGRRATADEIQRAYRKIARENHPDVNKDPAAEDRFKEAAEAYDVLSDPNTRSRYDAFGPDFRQVPEDMDPETWRQARAGGGRGGGGGSRSPYQQSGRPGPEFDFDMDDLFSQMFGGQGRPGQGRQGRGRMAGADQEAEITLSVEEAYRGGRRSITMGGKRLDVNIPAGVADGQRIRLAGQGGQGAGGGAAGDLYLIVRIAPHRRYRLDGRDISVDLLLTPWEAALGTDAAVDTPGGEAKVKVRPGTSSGKRLRLKGRGMPNPKGGPGDLYAEVKIMVPPSPTDDERRLFEELARVSTFDPRRAR